MLRQNFQQKLLQKLSPQQIQLMKLLQLPTIALEQRIKEELELNPAMEEGPEEDEKDVDANDDNELETEDTSEENERQDDEFDMSDYMDDDDDSEYKYNANNSSADDDKKEIPYASGPTFQELLEQQLGLKEISDNEYQIASYLIGNIDEDGYLRRDLESIVDDIAFSQNISTTKEELEKLLHIIQTFDPAGVGARNLQECLLLQLKRKEPQSFIIETAIKVVDKQMEEFSKKHYEKIAKYLEIDDEEIFKEVIEEITKLNPRPGSSLADSQKSVQQVIPDFTLTNTDGILEVTLNSRNAPELRVSGAYAEMLNTYSKSKDKSSKDAVMFVKQKIDSARGFIDAIKQRQHTLLYTMNAILQYQYNFFLEGDETKLKPMILKDIAERVGLDISTVSRVVNSKYVQTSFGTFLLKSFFSESMATDSGEEVSTREVKKILEDCISAENKKKPLTDDALTKILKEKGYTIARRTVAKYREQLEIPVARMRKEV
ncbi:MAG: RNA polymerase factor sigma-54 [Bacteroidetes bacterium]|nr:RNA polymerase factor sigma-54 [Bacteroidota bacterium]